MAVTRRGMTTTFKLEQPLKVPGRIEVTVSGITNFNNAVQPRHAARPIVFTFGASISTKAAQPSNARSTSSITIFVSPVRQNAESSTSLTNCGIPTSVSAEQ